MESISFKRRIFEIVAVLVTGLGKILFVNVFNQKFAFTLVACLFWIGYITLRFSRNPELLEYWGFTKKNFGKSFRKLLPYALICVLLFLLYGIYFDTIILKWHALVILLIYPIWGVIQQYLVVGLVAGNLADQKQVQISRMWIIIGTSVLFSIVHYPSLMLIIGTFFLALVYVVEYLKERNLWVLGIYHGWLGCFYYYLVLNRDPFVEMFGWI